MRVRTMTLALAAVPLCWLLCAVHALHRTSVVLGPSGLAVLAVDADVSQLPRPLAYFYLAHVARFDPRQAPSAGASLIEATLNGGEYASADERRRVFEVAELFLRRGADVNAVSAGPSLTPLHAAVLHGDAEIVTFLLSHGADRRARITHGTWAGRTPLELADILADAGEPQHAGERARIDAVRRALR